MRPISIRGRLACLLPALTVVFLGCRIPGGVPAFNPIFSPPPQPIEQRVRPSKSRPAENAVDTEEDRPANWHKKLRAKYA